MKIYKIYAIDEHGFDIAFLPTIIFSKYKDKKSLKVMWLFFEIDINF